MTVHAFADESRRGSTYLIAVAIVEPTKLRMLRRELRGLLMPGQRELHFKREREPRQRELAAAIARLPVQVHIYTRSCVPRQELARQACIKHMTHDLLGRDAHRLVLDSRAELDLHDEETIRAVIARHPHCTRFVYEHVDSVNEAILWVADAAAWCFGAGGYWRKRLAPIIGASAHLG